LVAAWAPVAFLRLKNKKRHDEVVALIGKGDGDLTIRITIRLDGDPVWN
jgi:hypothetical protein